MKGQSVTFLGGCNEVGRSSFLIDAGDKILLEHGIKILPDSTEYPLPVKTNLDAAIVSHAHLDHSGNLPHLYVKSRFLSYMTLPTLSVSKMLWFDSLKVAGLESMEPEFSKEEIRKTEKYAFPTNYNRVLNITKNVSMEFFDAGHILGSAMTKLLFSDGKNLLYTGDFKVDETRLFKGADLKVGKVDCLIIESTYGDRDHPPRKEVEKAFVEMVLETVDSGGTALVPAFAVGRSQEIIDILFEYKISVPIYLDGLCQKASRISVKFPEYLKDVKTLKKALAKAVWIKNSSMRKKALKEPSVIVTTAGMVQGGPVIEYLKKVHADENSSILLTGYQVKDTPGDVLFKTKRIAVENEVVEVKAKVEKFDFSAHASQSEMLKAIKKWNPEKIILVHGDPECAKVFKEKIREEFGINALIPNLSETIVL